MRLFTHVPWLRQRLLATVEEYARGISIDFSGITDATAGIDPTELFSDPSKLEELISSSTSFEPTTTPNRRPHSNASKHYSPSSRLGGKRCHPSTLRSHPQYRRVDRDDAPQAGQRWSGRADLRHPRRPRTAPP